MTRHSLVLAAAAALSLIATAAPAGPEAPMMTRVVTMDGRTGPAFYSAVEGRYRFVEAQPTPSRYAALPAKMR